MASLSADAKMYGGTLNELLRARAGTGAGSPYGGGAVEGLFG